MVIEDLSVTELSRAKQTFKMASAMDRFLAGVFDVLLLTPIITLVPALHIQEVRLDYLQGFESNLWMQIGVLWILSAILLQTIFLYFMKATPGGMIMSLRVQSVTGKLGWNQCLMRSSFYILSILMLGLPLLEIITHPFKRALHDRVSDTVVTDLKVNAPAAPKNFVNPVMVRAFMIVGIALLLFSAVSFTMNPGEFTYNAESSWGEDTDAFIAQALLRKDESEEMQNEVEEKIWSSRKNYEKALAYFFKLQVEKNTDVRKALADQICRWKSLSLCALAEYQTSENGKTLSSIAAQLTNERSLTARVFLMKELTKNSEYRLALKYYKQLKEQALIEDSMKMWDVNLFWAIREKQMAAASAKSNRMPASEKDTQDESKALQDYIKERGLP